MTKININGLLQNFFNKNPDIREARNKGLVNRRALAGYIIKNEMLAHTLLDAVLTPLRRFETQTPTKSTLDIVTKIKIPTKENIAIVYLEKTETVLKNISKIVEIINFNKNETLKIVQGSLSVKLFVDEFNIDKLEGVYNAKDIIKIQKNISELTLIFPEEAVKTKGIITYVTSELSINNINLVEMLTGKPELILYLDEKDLLKAYEIIKRLRNGPLRT